MWDAVEREQARHRARQEALCAAAPDDPDEIHGHCNGDDCGADCRCACELCTIATE